MSSIKKRNVQGPAGGAGLIRYFDVDEGGMKIEPKVIIALVVVLIILEIVLGMYLTG